MSKLSSSLFSIRPFPKLLPPPLQFGGKLITFDHTKAPVQPGLQVTPQQVFISQVTTEAKFLARSQQLQEALQSGSLLAFCQKKIEAAQESSVENIWNFLKVGPLWVRSEAVGVFKKGKEKTRYSPASPCRFPIVRTQITLVHKIYYDIISIVQT